VLLVELALDLGLGLRGVELDLAGAELGDGLADDGP